MRIYFENAKSCVVEKEFPGYWKQMVYTCLKKKHGDQRRVRKVREIALMDQSMKLRERRTVGERAGRG